MKCLYLIKYHRNGLENAVDKVLVLHFSGVTINPAQTEYLCIQGNCYTIGRDLSSLKAFDLNLFEKATFVSAKLLLQLMLEECPFRL